MRQALSILFILYSSFCLAQKVFWVNTSEKHMLAPLKPRFCSEWLGYCSYEIGTDQESYLPPSGHQVLTFEPQESSTLDDTRLGFALEQIEADLLIEKGWKAKGFKIGIIDGGFLGAPEEPALKHFFENNLVANYRDYVTPNSEKYTGSNALDDNHGTVVWQMIGGKSTDRNLQWGLATEATYYLARTDHGAYEKRIEEDYLIAALEWMEKEGIKLVNISLGYAKGYNDPNENYQPMDMNGEKSMIARAVDHAFYEKDMLIVVAAGNEGLDPTWQVLSTPGDAKGALTVGSAKLKSFDKMDYSSIGPDFLNYVKPNVSTYSTSGTSFAAPIITGLAAAIWNEHPEFSAKEVRSLIEQSSNLYPYGNNHVGYGVPRCSVLLNFLAGIKPTAPLLLKPKKDQLNLRGSYAGKRVILFHKKDSIHIIKREFLRPEKNNFKVERAEDAQFTTIMVDGVIKELQWKND